MKKFVFVLALLSILTVGAFADHPNGFGIGLGYKYGAAWEDIGNGGSEVSVFAKLPDINIFWGVTVDFFEDNRFGIGVTGDRYFYDQWLVPDIKLGWFLGVGGYFNWRRVSGEVLGNDWAVNDIDLGVRVPIGLTWQPLPVLEIFIDVAPSVGFKIEGDAEVNGNVVRDGDMGLGGGWQGDFGFRVWL